METVSGIVIVSDPTLSVEAPTILGELQTYIADSSEKVNHIADPVKREAVAIEITIGRVMMIQESAGQIILAALWRMYDKRLYLVLGHETFQEWVRDVVGKYDPKTNYARELALVVERVISRVQLAANTNTPYKVEGSDEIITTDRLLNTNGLLWKLKAASATFADAERSGNKKGAAKLISAVVTGTRKAVETVRNEVGKNETRPQIHGWQAVNADATVDITLPGLTGQQLAFIAALFGDSLTLEFVTGDSQVPPLEPAQTAGVEKWKTLAASLINVLKKNEDMRWTVGDWTQAGHRVFNTHILTMRSYGLSDDTRYQVYALLFGRDIPSSKNLIRAEAETLNRICGHPNFLIDMEAELT